MCEPRLLARCDAGTHHRGVDGDGDLDIVVSLNAEDRVRSVEIYEVAGSADNCLLWPTGRGNLLRDGFVRGN